MGSDSRTESALNKDVSEVVANAKVFVVGAGGIGCELIKNLVLTGFRDLEIIDLDTIDVSNLNRQFLFQKKHVGKSKAKVAHENAVSLRQGVKVKSHHTSIFSAQFNMPYFKQFDIVLNALDNQAARNHVNRICLAAGVPLVESGSAGYLGQVSVIKKGVTECYECAPKPRQKTFPGCTIRNTPSELIHCIVWAKYLFNQLFGEEDADQDVSPDTADPEAAMQDSAVIERVSTRTWAKENEYHPEKIFNKLFKTDIDYLLSMEKLWEKRTPPTPLSWTNSLQGESSFSAQKVLTLEENMQLFAESILQLKNKFLAEGEDGTLVWDKDDSCAMNFVASTANIRAKIFGIPQNTIFEIKSMAGNIIPAIATTNAVVAGLIVMQAVCILNKQFQKCRNVYIRRTPNPAKKLVAPCVLDPPNPSCYACAEKPEVTIKLNTKIRTLGDLKEKILKKRLGMQAPDVEVDGTGTIILSSEGGESDEHLPKVLCDFGIMHGTRLRADDFLQNFDIVLNILHSEEVTDEEEFEIVGQSGDIAPKAEENEKEKQSTSNDVDDGDDLVIVENDENNATDVEPTTHKKRRLSSVGDGDGVAQNAKRPRMSPVVVTEPDNDIMIIE